MTRSALLASSAGVVVCAVFGPASVAHAYLDPGSGSFVLQMVVAGILGALLYLKLAWQSVKAFFQRLFSRGPTRRTESEVHPGEET